MTKFKDYGFTCVTLDLSGYRSRSMNIFREEGVESSFFSSLIPNPYLLRWR